MPKHLAHELGGLPSCWFRVMQWGLNWEEIKLPQVYNQAPKPSEHLHRVPLLSFPSGCFILLIFLNFFTYHLRLHHKIYIITNIPQHHY